MTDVSDPVGRGAAESAATEHPYAGDDGNDGRCECGYMWYPKGGPVRQRHDEQGFAAATRALRAFVAEEPENAANIVAELRYWLHYLGGAAVGSDTPGYEPYGWVDADENFYPAPGPSYEDYSDCVPVFRRVPSPHTDSSET